MTKFVSEWNKPADRYTFPEGMPESMRTRVINLRRWILAICYIQNGIQEEYCSAGLFSRMADELQMLQAAWGYEFNFYDYLFDEWSEDKEDHLFTNNGCDSGIVNHAIKMLNAKKQARMRYNQSLKGHQSELPSM